MIKIDVEGYEGEVLRDVWRTIERWRPNLFVEIRPRMLAENYTVDGILKFLWTHYADVELYQLAQWQSIVSKVLSRCFEAGRIDALQSRDIVISRCEQGLQDTFWAVCRSPDGVDRRRTGYS